MVSLTITLVILGGLGYIGWLAFQQKKQVANSQAAQRRRSRDRNTSRIMSDFAASTQP
jgi:predicted negative regulator of RcsB-dependent stress response